MQTFPCDGRTTDRRYAAATAICNLIGRGDDLILTPQVVIEFWGVATRPVAVNGLGLSPRRTEQILNRLERFCRLVPDPPNVYEEWRRLVVTHQVSGKKVHDARLAAVM